MMYILYKIGILHKYILSPPIPREMITNSIFPTEYYIFIPLGGGTIKGKGSDKMLSFKKERLPFREIDINLISPNPNQPRKRFLKEDLESLSKSIRQYGIINPLTVREVKDGFELISGERRLMAAKLAGLMVVPCHVIEAERKKSAEIAIVENVVRADLSFFEEAMAFARLCEEFGMTQKEVAERIGKTQSAVANKIRLLKLSKAAVAEIEKHGLTERHARALLRIEDETLQAAAAAYIGEKQLNVAKSEEHIDMILKNSSKKQRSAPKILLKDIRIFANTVKNMTDSLRLSGISAVLNTEESDDFVLYTVKISKTADMAVAKNGKV